MNWQYLQKRARIRLFAFLVFLISTSSLALFTTGIKPKESFDQLHAIFYDKQVSTQGNQVLHCRGLNKPYQYSPESQMFIEKFCGLARNCNADSDVLRIGSDFVGIDGEYVCLGVGVGKALNFVAALNPTKTVYGFDSFTEKDTVTPFLHNVEVIEGFFRESLPIFISQQLQGKPIAFVYINCNTYEATKEALLYLKDYIQDSTVIVFDEFYNFPGFRDQEMRAFYEFCEQNDFYPEYLAYNSVHEQVAVRLHKRWGQMRRYMSLDF